MSWRPTTSIARSNLAVMSRWPPHRLPLSKGCRRGGSCWKRGFAAVLEPVPSRGDTQTEAFTRQQSLIVAYTYSLTESAISINYMFMTKASAALDRLPPATIAAIEKLGADLAVARLRRGESLKVWAKRMGISIPTLQRLEAGDPGVSIGILATALWLLGRDGQLTQLAAPENDQGAIELSVQEANQLGRTRAQASAEARMNAARRNTR